MKKILILALLAISAFSAGEGLDLSGLEGVSTSINDTTQTVAGTFFKLVFAFLPMLAFVVAPIVTYMVKKDEAKQNRDDHMGIWLWVVGSAIVGFIGGTAVVYIIGMGLLGDGTEALNQGTNWWKTAIGIGN